MYYDGLGDLGQTRPCEDYAKLTEIYRRLSEKTDKKKETRANAASIADQNWALYQDCLNKQALAAAGVAQTPVEAAQPASVIGQPRPQAPAGPLVAPIVGGVVQVPQGGGASSGVSWTKVLLIAGAVGFGVWWFFLRKKQKG